MADLHLRLGRDVLTIADCFRTHLMFKDVDFERDAPLALLVEPENYEHLLSLDALSGAPCVVINSFSYCPAKLRISNSLDKAEQLAQKMCSIAKGLKIQHPLLKVEPCGLPFDENSKASLNEHCEQYKFIGNLFDDAFVDGFLLTGFDNVAELKCAMTGIRKASGKTILYDTTQFEADVPLEEDFAPASNLRETIDTNPEQPVNEVMARAEEIARKGQQFLYLKNSSSVQASTVAAIMRGVYL